LVQDLTTNNYTSFCALHANNDYRSGPTAEWIVERPTVSGSYTKLANFGSETFTNAYAATPSSSQALGSWTKDTLYMRDIFNIQLAHPGSLLSSTSFTDYWDNYGN
jgi:hypothetical protein